MWSVNLTICKANFTIRRKGAGNADASVPPRSCPLTSISWGSASPAGGTGEEPTARPARRAWVVAGGAGGAAGSLAADGQRDRDGALRPESAARGQDRADFREADRGGVRAGRNPAGPGRHGTDRFVERALNPCHPDSE